MNQPMMGTQAIFTADVMTIITHTTLGARQKIMALVSSNGTSVGGGVATMPSASTEGGVSSYSGPGARLSLTTKVI